MAGTKSPTGVRITTNAYENFQGLDTSRDITSLDTGSDQHLSKLVNATCDWRGQIVRDPACKYRSGEGKIIHNTFFSTGEMCWAQETGAAIDLKSDREHQLENAYRIGSTISSTVFNQAVIFTSRGQPMYRYDGVLFERNQSPAVNELSPGFAASIQRRLVVAGIPGRETEVHLSRVDQDNIFPDDEDEESENVLRAGFIDIANLLGTADKITGLGSFEQNRLAVFTADRTIIYRIDPDIDRWIIDENANIQIGCASHNTIVNAGTDLVFCSRSGIHSIQRSETNGILVFSVSLSDKIDILYRELFDSVEDKTQISAVFDQDKGQYHVFFPQPGGVLCRRLTLALNPEGGELAPKYSVGDFLNSRCGAFLNGSFVFGTTGGNYDALDVETEDPDAFTPDVEVLTPILWHGSLSETKDTHSLIIQAAGQGTLEVDAQDIHGRQIGSLRIEIDDTPDDNFFPDVPLSKQYERKWSHRYKGAQYRFRTVGGAGLMRLIGFAVTTRN